MGFLFDGKIALTAKDDDDDKVAVMSHNAYYNTEYNIGLIQMVRCKKARELRFVLFFFFYFSDDVY